MWITNEPKPVGEGSIKSGPRVGRPHTRLRGRFAEGKTPAAAREEQERVRAAEGAQRDAPPLNSGTSGVVAPRFTKRERRRRA
jgi:hypothetical protein